MQALYEKALKDIEMKKKPPPPWIRNEPYTQPYYGFSPESKQWTPIRPSDGQVHTADAAEYLPSTISLYSWNVDFMLPHTDARMNAALAHLVSIVRPTRPSALAVMLLQEMLDSDLKIISEHPGIRAHFYMTDLTPEYWESGHYGTVTLIDRRLPVVEVFRVHYLNTHMQRDALFVDVQHPASSNPVRFCNTHLESLVATPPRRPQQMQIAAKFMHDDKVVGSILAGDLNAIEPFDQTLHSITDLKDAFLELGGDEKDEAGHTWGQQAATHLRKKFGTSRMDKVFFCGRVEVKDFGHFGIDVVVEDKNIASDLQNLDLEKPWVTDHFGVRADFELK